MHLNSLYMRNFKKYREVTIEFQDGLTGIVGRNGSGKSSIVEAIAWALYGNKASIVRRDFIKNSRAGEQDKLVVKLDLNLDNKEMTIERAMRGKSLTPEARLDIDGEMVATGTREVENLLENLLNISFQDFMKTFYARQKDLDNLLKEGGTKKKEYLLTLLGLDEIRARMFDDIRRDTKKLDGEVGRLEGALSEIGDVSESLDGTRENIALAKKDLSSAEVEAAESLRREEECERGLEVVAERKRHHESISEEILRLESSIAKSAEAISRGEAKLEEIEEGKWKLFELEPKLARLKEVRAALEEMEPKRKEHQSLSQARVKIESGIEVALQSLRDLESRRDRLEAERSKLDSIRPEEEEHARLALELNDLEERREAQRKLSTQKENEQVRLESLEENAARIESTLKELEESRSRMEEIEPFCAKYERIEIEVARLDQEREKKRHSDDLSERKDAILERMDKIAESKALLTSQITSLGNLEEEEAKLKQKDEELDLLESELNRSIAQMRLKQGLLKSRIDDAKKHLANVEGLGEESNCPTCERPLGDQYRLLVQKYQSEASAAKEEMASFRANIKGADDRLNQVTVARGGLKGSFADLIKKKSQRGEILAEIRSQSERSLEFGHDIQEIEREAESLGAIEYDPESHSLLVSEIEELRPLLKERAELQIRLEEIPHKKTELEAANEARTSLSEKIERLKVMIDQTGYDEPLHLQKRARFQDLVPLHERFSALVQRVEEIPLVEAEILTRKDNLTQIQGEAKSLKNELDLLCFDPLAYEAFLAERKGLRKSENAANEIRIALASEPEVTHNLNEAKTAAENLKLELESARKRLFDLDYKSEAYREAKGALGKAKTGREDARERVGQLQVQVGVLERDLQRLCAEAERKEELSKRLEEARREIEVVETTRSLTNRFMDHILERVRTEIALNAGRILREVAGKYGRVSIDEAFNILVEDEGEFYPISRFSGGEIDMIAVSVRVAISEYLMRFGQNGPGYSFLILDEVFGSQDVEHRESMINMLRSLDDRFPQIFAISHISEVQGQFDNTIQVVEEDDGSSRVEVEMR